MILLIFCHDLLEQVDQFWVVVLKLLAGGDPPQNVDQGEVKLGPGNTTLSCGKPLFTLDNGHILLSPYIHRLAYECFEELGELGELLHDDLLHPSLPEAEVPESPEGESSLLRPGVSWIKISRG